MELKKGRAARVDKKVHVRGWIPKEMYSEIYRMSTSIDVAIKNIGEELCRRAIGNKEVMTHLSMYLKQDIRIDNTVYIGNINNLSPNQKGLPGANKPISIRFTNLTMTSIRAIAAAMECTPSKACALLLITAMDNGLGKSYQSEYVQDKPILNIKSWRK